MVVDDHLELDVAALSEAAWTLLQPGADAVAVFSHPEPPVSAPALRAKVFGQRLSETDFLALMRDTVSNRLSDMELTAFVTACAGDRLDNEETIALTKAMLAVGECMDWGAGAILDKHCVGGLPGNRTTPIVVAIVAAAGHRIPKTSSRAITSPAGTADAMEVMAPVALDLEAMRNVVEREGGCIVWGGNVRLSPADDILIRIERPLDFDSDGQLVASVLSKKAAAGATHVVIDVPIGPTAKVRSFAAAASLEAKLIAAAQALGLNITVLRTDGLQPVGYGIGPALEARDVLSVLRNARQRPAISAAVRSILLASCSIPHPGRCKETAAPWRPRCSTVARLSASLWQSARHRAALPSREWPHTSAQFSPTATARFRRSTIVGLQGSPSSPARQAAHWPEPIPGFGSAIVSRLVSLCFMSMPGHQENWNTHLNMLRLIRTYSRSGSDDDPPAASFPIAATLGRLSSPLAGCASRAPGVASLS
ncbi:hypothetical protein GCM10007880_03580 [Mesorhizobium amorphae]|nr:hypothetical protein GCM10007880_03580 [Mesorhizobium amorphae]